MIKFAKVRDVKTPSRGTSMSAGMDFFVPNKTAELIEQLILLNKDAIKIVKDGFYIKSFRHALIPSGIIVDLQSSTKEHPYGLSMVAHNKSSIGIRQLSVAATVVDADYIQECHISLMNHANMDIKIEYGQKIVQFLLIPVLIEPFEEVDISEIECLTSERTGGFGSTGNK